MNGDSRGSRDLQDSTQFVCAYYFGTDVFTTEKLCGFFLGFMYLQTNFSKCMSHFELLITLQATHLQNGFEKKIRVVNSRNRIVPDHVNYCGVSVQCWQTFFFFLFLVPETV